MPASTDPFSIDIVSDLVCPWCYIGKRRLETALSQLTGPLSVAPAAVRWHPFQLNPQLPSEGMPRQEYLEKKFGGPEQAADVYARIEEAGRSVGLDMHFDRVQRQPNTVDAHRLIAWAQQAGDAEPLIEALFRAYFTEGRAIGERNELRKIAGESGFDATAAEKSLESDFGYDAISTAAEQARQLGISSVPFFIFNRKVAVSGAQEPGVLLEAIAQGMADTP